MEAVGEDLVVENLDEALDIHKEEYFGFEDEMILRV